MIIIDSKVKEKFPFVKIGCVIAKGIDNTGKGDELDKEMQKVEELVKSKFDIQTLVDNPKIKDWRDAYLAFGAKPKTFKNSVEALIRRILKHGSLPRINKIVDIYNMISVKHVLPAGGDDLDKVDGDVSLTIAKGGEEFVMLGGEKQTAKQGEVIYRDDNDVLCRRWNWRECEKTKMTEETKNVCLVLEGLSNTTDEELKVALEELKEMVGKYCGGEVKI